MKQHSFVKAIGLLSTLVMMVFFHSTALAASCISVEDDQESFGNPYWISNFYFDGVTHPPQHATYPEVRLTWKTLLGQQDACRLQGPG